MAANLGFGRGVPDLDERVIGSGHDARPVGRESKRSDVVRVPSGPRACLPERDFFIDKVALYLPGSLISTFLGLPANTPPPQPTHPHLRQHTLTLHGYLAHKKTPTPLGPP